MKKRFTNSALITLLVICSLISLLIMSCSTTSPSPTPATPATPTGPKYGGILRIANATDTSNIGYPPRMTVVASTTQGAPAIESLFRSDKSGKPIPYLVEKEESNAAAKTITLTLKKGIKFHDGTDFNAEAVKWNLDQCVTAKTGGTEGITSMEVIDPYTVRINLKVWDNTFLTTLTQTPGAMISPTAFKTNSEDWCMRNPVGTGPFKFVSWVKDSKVTYTKFDGYWQKGKPYLDGIEWGPITEITTREFALRKGEIDVGMWFNAKEVQSLEKDGFVVTRGRAGSGAIGLGPDAANPKSPWAELKVRQAAQHAIDTAAIAKTIYQGEGEATNQWIYKSHWGYNPSITGYPYNPTKAKQLLTEAGYPNGFKTKIAYLSTQQNAENLMVATQGYFKAVGIEAELEPILVAKWSAVALNSGSWEGLFWAGISPNPDLAGALYTRYIGGGRYYSQMLFPEDYVQAVKNAIAAPDFDSKIKFTQEAMKLSIDKYCNRLVFASIPDLVAAQKYVKNVGIFATANSAWWTPEEVWLDK